jgi:hypothetical protein
MLPTRHGTSLVGFHIQLDVRNINNSRHIRNYDSFPTTVVVHEFGHVLGLRDRPEHSGGGLILDTVMNGDTAPENRIAFPSIFDIQSVRILYG